MTAPSSSSFLLPVDQALDLLLAAANPVTEVETLPMMQAQGRILAADQVSSINVPPADNAQMDGYAVRAAECASGAATLRVSQRIAAGAVGEPLQAGTAARIFTGAMVPAGADAVVMQELCEACQQDEGEAVTIRHIPQAGEWIRRAGEDIRAGSVILQAGQRLRAQELGLAASIGLASLPVVRRLRVAVFSTGNELVKQGEPLAPGAIYNTNGFTLCALLHNLGCDVRDCGSVPDALESTRDALYRAAQEHDVVITSGGVSVGEEDHVKPAVEANGRLALWQIAVKPGKPLAFGEINRTQSDRPAFFFGLPGNPVSCFVTFLLFVRPFLLRLQGVEEVTVPFYTMRADFDWLKADRRNEFLRVKINARGGLDVFPNQGSGVLTSMVWGDGLVDNPPGCTIACGDKVRFLSFRDLMA